MLRSVVLPAVAVAFDLLTAGATFGILSLLYSGQDALLGGPGYIDPISIIGIFAFIFGVSMVYEVALLYRIREAFLATGDAQRRRADRAAGDRRGGDRRRGRDARRDHPVRHGRPAERAGVRRRRRHRDRARRADRAAGAPARRRLAARPLELVAAVAAGAADSAAPGRGPDAAAHGVRPHAGRDVGDIAANNGARGAHPRMAARG